MIDAKSLLAAYRYGLGFREGDILVPREGCKPMTYGVIDDTVVVLRQISVQPSHYEVIGECRAPSTPGDRHVKFEIDGYQWKKIGRA